jgi:DNA helicase-2/ATP-dependent DNA helicase PcrA
MGELKLNQKQQEAVNHIYGPLLVLAGPGTGKTQLLSARIANILSKTDASAHNILCLTFTENAAQNMRDRLTTLIKDDAYDVHIGTYHSFGSDIIRTYPEYFESINLVTEKDSRLERPVNDLQAIQILTRIIDQLPYTSPLASAKYYVKHVLSTISELKRGLYTPDTLEKLAEQNIEQVKILSPLIHEHLGEVKRFPSKAEQSIELFGPILELLEGKPGLAESAHQELARAMLSAHELNKSTPLTEWKNTWLTKDAQNSFTLTEPSIHARMFELSKVYHLYQEALNAGQLYDFDDMILRTIGALRDNPELKYTLQEKYQFILLDEFQDTNAAQFELVRLLADNPVNEDQPNVFAVGDDDQAIYAFQGASISNMYAFMSTYRDVTVLNLTENYRSHPDILHIAHGIAGQIETRLHHQLKDINKSLQSAQEKLPPKAHVERHEFEGCANELSWVAHTIDSLIKSGVSPHEIAVLAPQHRYLELCVPFLAKLKVPVSYEKRENILDTKPLRQLRMMAELVLACSQQDIYTMNELFPRVLSLDFYRLSVHDIWAVNWAYNREKSSSWAEHALNSEPIARHVISFLALGSKCENEPLEYILDYLTGTSAVMLDADTRYVSPFKDYYFSGEVNALSYYETLTNLSTIREHLRAWQSGHDSLLTISDFLRFIEAYEQAEQPLINTHPVSLADDSVQLMTVYKSKGLEFEHVFLLSVHDDIWGKSARTNSNKLSLPGNLTHIRYQGSSEDELRRLLFVAITRAKSGLYLTSHTTKDNGKKTEPVKYLLEYSDGDVRTSSLLPSHSQVVKRTTFSQTENLEAIDTMWHTRHVHLDASLKSLLCERLQRYQMSPTHLNTFIDPQYGGPQAFLLRTLLRFPEAPGEDGEYGNAIHHALEQHQLRLNKQQPSTLKRILKDFDHNLSKRYIVASHVHDFHMRGHTALETYLSSRSEMFRLEAIPEVPFSKEGVLVGKALLSGKVDRLEIDKKNRTVDIVDYKTGTPHTKWDREVKLLKYRQQLYFYKLLIEGSHTWSEYKVKSARLEFIEPDSQGMTAPPLYIDFNDEEEKELKILIHAVWERIQSLDLPDITTFTQDYKGAQEFISYLLSR